MLALVTDSTCGLTRVEAAELGVIMAPMTYATGGTRRTERPVGENGDYAALLAQSGHVETEAVRTSVFRSLFRTCLERGNEVLCLTISGRLSGTLRSAEEAAAAVGDPRVAVMDSWCTAGALEFMLRRARALADAGKALDEVVEGLKAARGEARVVFSVPDLNALTSSGRLGAFRRALATKLSRYPVMTLSEGGIVKLGEGRGVSGMAHLMVRQVPADADELLIQHFGARGDEARELFLAARSQRPDARVRVKDGGPVLAKHLGLGAVAVSWV